MMMSVISPPDRATGSAAFRLLSIFRKQSARYRASADKFGDGARNGFGLLQHQKMSCARQVDNPDALAELLAERGPIARLSRYIIEPLDHQKRGRSGAPPILERHPPAGREMGEMRRRPAFDLRQYFRIGRRRQPARAQHGDAIAAIHLDFRSVAKARAQWRCRSDETARRKNSHATHQRGPVRR